MPSRMGRMASTVINQNLPHVDGERFHHCPFFEDHTTTVQQTLAVYHSANASVAVIARLVEI